MNTKPRCLSFVKFVAPSFIGGQKSAQYPFSETEVYVFLGEIPNMPEHCVVAARINGRIFSGYHSFLFRELTDDEV